MRDFLRALSFLTILPVGQIQVSEERELARSMAFFPFAGLAVGLLLVLVYYLLSSLLPRPIVLWLTIGCLAFLTRGLHLDGFADTLDGLAAGGPKDKILDVMRDSRIGAFGVVGLILLIGAKYLLLDQTLDKYIPRSLIAMTLMGRYAMVLVCYRSPYARPGEGLGRPFTEHLTVREIIISSVSTFGIGVLLMGFKGVLVFLGTGLFSLGYRLFFLKKLQGVTGDILGAANELTEVLCLILLVVLQRWA